MADDVTNIPLRIKTDDYKVNFTLVEKLRQHAHDTIERREQVRNNERKKGNS